MIKAIDLFSGCGGLSCGLTKTGFSVVVAVEIEERAKETYLSYPPLSEVNVLCGDIRNISGQKILVEGKIDPDELYLFAGCPPCQNFSRQNKQNKQKTENERKELLFRFLEVIKEIYPPFVLMENVPGIQSKSNKNIINEFLANLRNDTGDPKQGYYVVERVLNAADYGVPQLRKRFVMHAIRRDLYVKLQDKGMEFLLPTPTHDRFGKDGLQLWKTVSDTINDLPVIEQGSTYEGDLPIFNHKCAGLSEKNIRRIRAIRHTGGSRTSLPDELILKCHKKIKINDKGEEKLYSGHKDVYGIMREDKPAPTMTGGCLCYSKGRYGHPTQDRAISIREAARFQTFPDDFKFSDSLTHAAIQIGNAVPIKLVEASANVLKLAIETLKSSGDNDCEEHTMLKKIIKTKI